MIELNQHSIETKFIPAACATSRHQDFIAICSCGWRAKASHGELHSLDKNILGHRLQIIEEAFGIKFERRHVQ